MANHLRQQIREAVATHLTGLVTTGSRVYQSRVKVLAESELPALVILTNQENITTDSIHSNPLMNRELSLTVIARTKATSNLDDVLDTIIKEVEAKLALWPTNSTINALVESVVLQSIEVEINADNETPVGQAVLGFVINYFTLAEAPDSSI